MGDKTLQTALHLYDKAWVLAMPLLRLNKRLKEGFSQRKLKTPLPEADIWIQAASGGEAYLAWTLLKQLRPPGPIRVLVTTNTRQGMDIIAKAINDLAISNPDIALYHGWFPFDRPLLMNRAVSMVNPGLAILLESELWPGFINALKNRSCPVFIINGRMTEKSMSGYLRFPKFSKKLRPDHVLAISENDRKRFERVFGTESVCVMSNMKFDGLAVETTDTEKPAIPAGSRFVVFGSIRQEEEAHVGWMIQHLLQSRPDIVIGLFPRHLNRLDYWKKELDRLGIGWCLRSGIADVPQNGVVLWDVFGELSTAYAAARAVFVGGSLAPLGGQNFLEPLVYGTVPVIGPFYENFAWIGEEIFHNGLAIKTRNHHEAADRLISQIDHPSPGIASRAREFIIARQGGTRKACDLIEKTLIERKNR